MSCATSTDERSIRSRLGPSSPAATRSRPRCDHGRPECISHEERVAEDRGREAPHRPTRSPVTLSPAGLDIDWELNGAEFQSAFHYHVLDRGIGHVYIRPATPRLNGKVERSHRIDAEEFYRMLDGVVIDDAGVFNKRLREWEDFYNFNRPHGGLGGQTPYERLRLKTGSPV